MKYNYPIGMFVRIVLLLVLVIALISVASNVKARGTQANTIDVIDILIFYKLDPRLTGGIYMGDRWVSPPLYDIVISEGVPYTVEARAESVDANGQQVEVDAQWIPSDPGMLEISPGQDQQVNITILRTGRSNLQVTAGGITKTLYINAAEYICSAIRVQISKTAFPEGTTQQSAPCQRNYLPITIQR